MAVPQVTGHRDVHRIGVLGIDGDAGDALGFREAQLLPRVSAVGGLVDPIADRHAVPHPRFARAHPHRLRMLAVDGHGTDRLALLVEGWLECGAAVGRLPHAAARGADPQV
jgi:hypothetical protein